MKVENKVNPNADQMAGFMDSSVEGPIAMVNLLKFKEKAQYSDDRETDLSGAEAYGIYAQGVAKTLAMVGGKMLFFGNVGLTEVGFWGALPLGILVSLLIGAAASRSDSSYST